MVHPPVADRGDEPQVDPRQPEANKALGGEVAQDHLLAACEKAMDDVKAGRMSATDAQSCIIGQGHHRVVARKGTSV
jgi:hypothetical protein